MMASTFRRPVLAPLRARLAALLLALFFPIAVPGAVAADFRIALIMSGPVADGGWDDLAYAGLKELGTRPGIKGVYADNVSQAQIPQVVRGYADDGYDLIIGHGFEFGSALIDIAPDYPKTKFFATTFRPTDKVPANLEFVDLAYYDASYAAGALAALISDKKLVGFVGGGDNPTQKRMMQSFIVGAERTVSGTKGEGVITGDYNNPAKGKQAAATMIGNGADVIWHAADVTGLGAIQAAVERNVKVIGSYSDQTAAAPDLMATSLVINLGGMVTHVAESAMDGSFLGGGEWKPAVTEVWRLQAGPTGDHNAKVVPDSTWARFAAIWADLGSHKIDVHSLVP